MENKEFNLSEEEYNNKFFRMAWMQIGLGKEDFLYRYKNEAIFHTMVEIIKRKNIEIDSLMNKLTEKN